MDMAENNAVIVTAKDKEIPRERDNEMKSGMEAHLKQMQDKMNEMELKVNNMGQLTKDLDEFKANLHVQTERLNICEMQLKDGLPDMKTVPMFKEMRDEMEKMKVEQTRLALKANDDSAAIYTVKGRADAFIQLLEQKDEKMEKKLNEHKANINAMIDVYKNQLEDVKTTIASMDTDRAKEPRALDQVENKVLEMRMMDLQKQYEWLTIMKQFTKDERYREVEQTKLNGTELVEMVEKMKAEMHKDGDELRLNMDNQITTINKQLETIDNRVAESENKWASIDTRITTIGNEVHAIDDGVATNNEMTIMNKNLVMIENKVDGIDNQITNIDEKVTTMSKRLTWMENWQKKLQNIGQFGTLSQRNECLVSEFAFTVKNIGEEITKAKNDKYHRIESQPFYTNIMGYRAKIQVYLNESKTDHVGVFLSLVEGEFDDKVSWPFICKYEFSSVSRDGTQFASFFVNPKTSIKGTSSFLRPLKKSNSGYGTREYINIQKLLLNKDKYLIDGGLKIKTTIWLDN